MLVGLLTESVLEAAVCRENSFTLAAGIVSPIFLCKSSGLDIVKLTLLFWFELTIDLLLDTVKFTLGRDVEVCLLLLLLSWCLPKVKLTFFLLLLFLSLPPLLAWLLDRLSLL